jgi:biopolymer transport protein ExbB/TolQ
MIENALEVLRLFCMSFCGPVLLAECIITLSYYPQIAHGCHKIRDGFTNVMIYVLIIVSLVSFSVTIFCCYSALLFGKTIKDVWSQIRNPEPFASADNLDAESIRSQSEEGAEDLRSTSSSFRYRGSLGRRYSESEQYRRLRMSVRHEEEQLLREMQAFLANIS